MARAFTPRIGGSGLTVHRALRRWLARELAALRPVIEANALACHADRYRKHFDTLTHTCLLLFHGLSGSTSLRQSYAAFPACRSLAALCGWTDEQPPVSYPQFADSNSSRPPAFLAGLLPALIDRARRIDPQADLPRDLRLLDATKLRLSSRLASWPTCHNGVHVQLLYQPALDLPERIVVLRDEKLREYQGMDETVLRDPATLAALQGTTLVFDLGYYSHARFEHLLAAGVHLVTRCQALARVDVCAERPVQQPISCLPAHRIEVLADQQVLVGSPNNNQFRRQIPLRRVTATVTPLPRAAQAGATTVTYRLLTDRGDLDAAAVVQLYLDRWQIELLFRWLKRVIKLVRPLGTKSREVVTLSVWLAVLVHLLTLLAAHALRLPRRSPALLVLLRTVLCALEPLPTDLPPPPQQLPLRLPGGL